MSIETQRDAERAKRRSRPTVDQRLLMAMNALMEEGEDFANTSIEQLSKKAGISRATFYLHFKDKAELISYLFEEVEQEIIRSAGQWFIDSSQATQLSFRDNLFNILTVYRANYAVIAAMHQTAMGNERVRERNRKMVDGFCEATYQAIGQLRDVGRAHPDVSDLVGGLITKAVFYVSVANPETISEDNIGATCDAWAHIVWTSFVIPDA